MLAVQTKVCKTCGEEKELHKNFAKPGNLDCNKCYHIRARQKKIAGATGAVRCPWCNLWYIHLSLHVSQAHGISKETLKELGLQTVSKEYSKRRAEVATKKNRSNTVGKKIMFKKRTLSFPTNIWPEDCHYAKFTMNKTRLTLQITPIRKPGRGIRALDKIGVRFYLSMPPKIIEQLQMLEPVIDVDDRIVKMIFHIDNEALLPEIEAWANGNTRNLAALTTFPTSQKIPRISIAHHLWPINAEYVLPIYETRRHYHYIGLVPVTRSGHIALERYNTLGKYVGTDQCLKIAPKLPRLHIHAITFLRENNIPTGNWLYDRRDAEGVLWFKYIKER